MSRMLFLASLLLFALVGCKSSDDDDDDSSTPKDTGVMDSGDMPDSGTPDTGTPDSGMPGACNPVDGTGCTNAGEFCVFVIATNQSQCRTLGSANAFETGCIVNMQNCAAGLTCSQLQGEAGPTCKQTCDPSNNGAPCSTLSGMSNTYVCTQLLINNMPTTYGVCQGVDTCQPYNDTCPAGEVCAIADSQGTTACDAEGPNAIGDMCGANGGCMRGGICVNVNNEGAKCHPPCDPMNAVQCTAPATCNEVAMGWGICI